VKIGRGSPPGLGRADGREICKVTSQGTTWAGGQHDQERVAARSRADLALCKQATLVRVSERV